MMNDQWANFPAAKRPCIRSGEDDEKQTWWVSFLGNWNKIRPWREVLEKHHIQNVASLTAITLEELTSVCGIPLGEAKAILAEVHVHQGKEKAQRAAAEHIFLRRLKSTKYRSFLLKQLRQSLEGFFSPEASALVIPSWADFLHPPRHTIIQPKEEIEPSLAQSVHGDKELFTLYSRLFIVCQRLDVFLAQCQCVALSGDEDAQPVDEIERGIIKEISGRLNTRGEYLSTVVKSNELLLPLASWCRLQPEGHFFSVIRDCVMKSLFDPECLFTFLGAKLQVKSEAPFELQPVVDCLDLFIDNRSVHEFGEGYIRHLLRRACRGAIISESRESAVLQYAQEHKLLTSFELAQCEEIITAALLPVDCKCIQTIIFPKDVPTTTPRLSLSELPRSLQGAALSMQRDYNQIFPKRQSLQWDFSRGHADLDVWFPCHKEVATLRVTTPQMFFLEQFATNSVLSLRQMLFRPWLKPVIMRKYAHHLLSLAHPKVAVLLKKPSGPLLSWTDQFRLNSMFSTRTSLTKDDKGLLVVPLLQPLSPQASTRLELEAQTITQEAEDKIRHKDEIKKDVCCIMTTRKTCLHDTLVQLVVSRLFSWFRADVGTIEEVIKELLQTKFLRRNEKDSQVYEYTE